MKRISSRITLAILTFFIGVGAVGLWYLSRNQADSQQSLSKVISSIPPVSNTFENPCDYPQPKYREIEGEEAVYLAECFVIQNGYTDLPPIADKSKLTRENLFPGTDEEGLKMRHDTLRRKAFSYHRSELYGGSWVVMFRYKPRPDIVKFYSERFDQVGRAVVMDSFGKDLMVMHSDHPLRTPGAKILEP